MTDLGVHVGPLLVRPSVGYSDRWPPVTDIEVRCFDFEEIPDEIGPIRLQLDEVEADRKKHFYPL